MLSVHARNGESIQSHIFRVGEFATSGRIFLTVGEAVSVDVDVWDWRACERGCQQVGEHIRIDLLRRSRPQDSH